MVYRFVSELWQYPGKAAWHFVTLPKDISEEIKLLSAGQQRGFGSVRVEVIIGKERWNTSLFPDSHSGCYMIPVKKTVRVAEHLLPGTDVVIELSIQLEI